MDKVIIYYHKENDTMDICSANQEDEYIYGEEGDPRWEKE